VGITSEVRDPDGRAVTLVDPNGGTFTAAGDFDRLIPTDDPQLPLLSAVDPFGEWSVPFDRLRDLAAEVAVVARHATEGAESRGLARLAAQVDSCVSVVDQRLIFIGD
jgi:hypothetical protein